MSPIFLTSHWVQTKKFFIVDQINRELLNLVSANSYCFVTNNILKNISSNISRIILFINVAYWLLKSYYQQMLLLRHKNRML